ncbi:hypothetical protein EX30DRAFT_360224 [Ascodesmis nigricans]|uniref:Long chronological lifespan protein 2 n=1 Tax=Ascodesmis nigricans TaxID=341454 RepID=A0A4S2MR67_9PEZI|nr:hypothetical protein EX30DRAFT_360224 [Ascodesmis nigricans]
MFGGSSGGGSGSGSGGGGQRQRGGGNVASDSAWYRGVFEKAPCDRYLCPGTLACVDKPTHCPCAWPDVEEKFELHEDGLAVCLSQSAVEGRTARKVELARKGLI